MGSRRSGREFALQVLYMLDVSKLERVKIEKGVEKGISLDTKTRTFAENIISGVCENKDELDRAIIQFSENWEMERMAALDRNILRIGAYELLYQTDTPVSVVIDEAVEIAKNFSTKDSGKFVNGILDKIKTKRSKPAA